MGSKSTSKHNLPEEIIEEILFNLPVKSLLRLKSVSKRWRFLISSKRFITHHLKKSRTDLSNHKLIVLNTDVINRSFSDLMNHSFRSCSLRSLTDDSNITSFDRSPLMDHVADHMIPKSTIPPFEYLPRRKYYNPATHHYNNWYELGQFYPFDSFILEILGSCNGLILIAIDRGNLFIWNPTTRQAKSIAPPACHAFSNDLWEIGDGAFVYGFGYDGITEEYKIVCVYFSHGIEPHRTATEIYSLRTGSWKKIEDFDMIRFRRLRSYSDGKFMHGKFVKGKLHWLTYPKEDGGRCEIVSLDLSEEKYGIVGCPDYFSRLIALRRPWLHELGGYLSFTAFNENFGMDVWVMTKYGETESWIKNWTFRPEMMHVCPLWLTTIEDGDIVACFAKRRRLDVVVYNESGNVLHKSRVDEYFANGVDLFDANMYVESLVSPFGDEQ